MEFETLIIIVIIGYLIYRLTVSDSQKRSRRPRQTVHGRRIRKTGKGAPRASTDRSAPETNSSLIQSAKRQERIGNYDEASRLYLRGGHVFSAAKMIAMKGPQEATRVVDLIRVNSPNQIDMIGQNLVNEFYYRLEQPATAAAILRAVGKDDEAMAVEVASGIAPPNASPSQASQTADIAQVVNPGKAEPDPQISDTEVITPENNIPSPVSVSTQTASVQEIMAEKPKTTNKVNNKLMMASVDLEDNCSVCKRAIKNGSSFLYCLNCSKPGHYKHLAEIMKVTGKCPNCKERLALRMYDLV